MRPLHLSGAGAGAALLALLVVALPSDAGPSARARATAAIITGAAGSVGAVRADNDDGQQAIAGAARLPGVRAASGNASAAASRSAGRGVARAEAAARSVDILDGLVTAYGVHVRARAAHGTRSFGGRVEGLVAAGQTIGDVDAPGAYDLGGNGTLFVLADGTGLRVHLTKDYDGHSAGTDISVATASATAADAPAAPRAAPARAKRRPAAASSRRRAVPRRRAPRVRPRLTGQRFTFPVYGHPSVADNFGAPREIGPHEGDDIFATYGSPVLAVHDGTVLNVGTLPISGNRLWLRTSAGDRFFYAHLSAFSPAAVDGARVKAGTVLGFVGSTGDAEHTPPHLHFEVHPRGGRAVDPYRFLRAWQSKRDVGPDAWLARYGADPGARPGVLVEMRDFIAGG